MTTVIYAIGKKNDASILFKAGKNNFLISYYYLKQDKRIIELLNYIVNKKNIFMLDSGAFSAWNNGTIVSLYEYINFIKQYHFYFTHVICLDVIDNPVLSEVNHLIMQKELAALNLTIIPVFHSGESFSVLDYMVRKGYKYLGISPNNNWPEKQKREWLSKVFSRHDFEKLGIKTHGFGYQSTDGLEYFPLSSADSTSWRIHAGYGRIITPKFAYLRYSEKSSEDNVKDMPGGSPEFVNSLCEELGITLSDLKETEYRVLFNIEAIDRLAARPKKDLPIIASGLFNEADDCFEEKVIEQLEICLEMGKEYKGSFDTSLPQKKVKKKKLIIGELF